jgi:hypothetical protein
MSNFKSKWINMLNFFECKKKRRKGPSMRGFGSQVTHPVFTQSPAIKVTWNLVENWIAYSGPNNPFQLIFHMKTLVKHSTNLNKSICAYKVAKNRLKNKKLIWDKKILHPNLFFSVKCKKSPPLNSHRIEYFDIKFDHFGY